MCFLSLVFFCQLCFISFLCILILATKNDDDEFLMMMKSKARNKPTTPWHVKMLCSCNVVQLVRQKVQKKTK